MEKVTFNSRVTKDPQFEKELNGIIAEFKNKAKEQAMQLKASPTFTLIQEGKFTADFLQAEFERIANKESTLPSSQREVVKVIIFNAAKRTVIMRQAERARKIEERANARVEAEEAVKEAAQARNAPKADNRKGKTKKTPKKPQK